MKILPANEIDSKLVTSGDLHQKIAFIILLLTFVSSLSCEKLLEPFTSSTGSRFEQVNLLDNHHESFALKSDKLLEEPGAFSINSEGQLFVCMQTKARTAVYQKDGIIINHPGIHSVYPNHSVDGLTAVVDNKTRVFILPNGYPASQILAATNGKIYGWSSQLADSVIPVSNSIEKNSFYNGLTIGLSNGRHYLYATNFKKGTIEVFDEHFIPTLIKFKDARLPANFAPVNIKCFDSLIYVLYVVKGKDGRVQKDIGTGLINVFHTNGSFLRRFATRELLNAPYGMTFAPASFIKERSINVSDDNQILLIGNSGEGNILCYEMNGKFLGELKNKGLPVIIDGLCALEYYSTKSGASKLDRLYFTSNPHSTNSGLIGYFQNK